MFSVAPVFSTWSHPPARSAAVAVWIFDFMVSCEISPVGTTSNALLGGVTVCLFFFFGKSSLLMCSPWPLQSCTGFNCGFVHIKDQLSRIQTTSHSHIAMLFLFVCLPSLGISEWNNYVELNFDATSKRCEFCTSKICLRLGQFLRCAWGDCNRNTTSGGSAGKQRQ